MLYLAIANKILHHCHFWLARQYMILAFGILTRTSTSLGPLSTNKAHVNRKLLAGPPL